MADPILDEIWRVREELVRKHGGFDGYFKYLQKLDRAHRQRAKRARGKQVQRQKLKKSS
jgi:hypothetical protein